jgi:curli biogenesis system outer membrane secretion channel CsgG
VPFHDKTGKSLDVTGLDELLAVELSRDPCVTLLERQRLQPVLDELSYCDPGNPDRAQFDCSTFAENGKLLGVNDMVFADVVAYEPSIGGAALAEKAGRHDLDANGTYGAVVLAVRVVDVETGKVTTADTVSAILPGGQAVFDGRHLHADAAASSATGHAFHQMLIDAARLVRRIDSPAR